MTRLMGGDQLLLMCGVGNRLAHAYLFHEASSLHILTGHGGITTTHGVDQALVEQMLNHHWGVALGDGGKAIACVLLIEIEMMGLAREEEVDELAPTRAGRRLEGEPAIEPSRTQERRIKVVGPVRRRRRLESKISSAFGGRVAEELIFGSDGVTTGAQSDIEYATEMARNMVTKWGLSDRLGPQSYSEDQGEVFLGRSVTQHKQVSDVTAHVIDEEVRRVIDANYSRARQLLETNLSKLHAMADALMRYETIGDEQIRDIMDGRDPRPPAGWEGGSKPSDPPPTAPAGATTGIGVGTPAGQH